MAIRLALLACFMLSLTFQAAGAVPSRCDGMSATGMVASTELSHSQHHGSSGTQSAVSARHHAAHQAPATTPVASGMQHPECCGDAGNCLDGNCLSVPALAVHNVHTLMTVSVGQEPGSRKACRECAITDSPYRPPISA